MHLLMPASALSRLYLALLNCRRGGSSLRLTLGLFVGESFRALNLLFVAFELLVLLPSHSINFVIRVLSHQRQNF